MVPQVYFFEHTERNGVDEHDGSVYAGSVHDENLLVAFTQTEEFGLGVVEGLLVVQVDEVFASFVGADSKSFLRESGALLDIPNFQDPVGIKSVDSSTRLIAN